jgi:hypothetical protein
MTPTSSSNGWTTVVNFYADRQNHFKLNAIPDMFRSTHQTTGVGIGLSSAGLAPWGFDDVTYNNTFWTTHGEASQNKYFQLYIQSPYTITNPVLYYSSYAPRTQQSMCNNGNFLVCRAYNSFFSRRYFLVAQRSGSTRTLNITDNLNFPQSD